MGMDRIIAAEDDSPMETVAAQSDSSVIMGEEKDGEVAARDADTAAAVIMAAEASSGRA
jgi:hypothetical protein